MLAEMYLGAGYLDGPRKFQKITFLHVWWAPQIRSLENGMEHGMEHGMEWGKLCAPCQLQDFPQETLQLEDRSGHF